MLTNSELKQIDGGKINFNIIASAAAIIAFLAGIVDGYLRPLKCN